MCVVWGLSGNSLEAVIVMSMWLLCIFIIVVLLFLILFRVMGCRVVIVLLLVAWAVVMFRIGNRVIELRVVIVMRVVVWIYFFMLGLVFVCWLVAWGLVRCTMFGFGM